uniref:Uncharacterized protein n=1 Tax=Lotharella globosa TaxID=91324 RepID=A0A7S3Z850_9EUKA
MVDVAVPNVALAFGLGMTIFVSTASEASWLAPFLTSTKYSKWARCLHAAVFIFALQAAVFASWLLAHFGAKVLHHVITVERLHWSTEVVLNIAAASLTWLLALWLFVRKWLRQRRWSRRGPGQGEYNEVGGRRGGARGSGTTSTQISRNNSSSKFLVADDLDVSIDDLEDLEDKPIQGYGSFYDSDEEEELAEKRKDCAQSAQPATVLVLSILGAMERVRYLPMILMSKTFTLEDLALGVAIASVSVIAMLIGCLSYSKFVLRVLERVPLWLVVAFFATVITVSAVLDKGLPLPPP